jgi:hypothetical protein
MTRGRWTVRIEGRPGARGSDLSRHVDARGPPTYGAAGSGRGRRRATVNRARENQLVIAIAAVAVAVAVLFLFRSGAGGPGGLVEALVATPTPAVSDQAKAEAVDLLALAAQQRAEGQFGAALELSDQSLGKWPQYDAAQRFVATVVPQATAVELGIQARATAVAQAAVRQAQAGAEARRVYVSRAGIVLQRYADALAAFYQQNREARDQPALVRDAVWRSRTGAALVTMRDAADALTALRPVPDDMVATAGLFGQLSVETGQLAQDFAGGSDVTAAAGEGSLPLASTRTERASELTRQANLELRRTSPAAA